MRRLSRTHSKSQIDNMSRNQSLQRTTLNSQPVSLDSQSLIDRSLSSQIYLQSTHVAGSGPQLSIADIYRQNDFQENQLNIPTMRRSILTANALLPNMSASELDKKILENEMQIMQLQRGLLQTPRLQMPQAICVPQHPILSLQAQILPQLQQGQDNQELLRQMIRYRNQFTPNSYYSG